MAETSKEQMDEAIARAKKEVADEVQDHVAEDKDLEDVAGGAQALWTIGVIYTT
jgi:hypothetical protein